MNSGQFQSVKNPEEVRVGKPGTYCLHEKKLRVKIRATFLTDDVVTFYVERPKAHQQSWCLSGKSFSFEEREYGSFPSLLQDAFFLAQQAADAVVEQLRRDIAPLKLRHALNQGSFGVVFAGRTKEGQDCAIKVEDQHRSSRGTLEAEYRAYVALQSPDKHTAGMGSGIARALCFQKTPRFHVLVLSLHGPSLRYWADKNKLTAHTTLLIAYQMLNILRFMHDKGYVHRDVKPANMVVGRSGDEGSFVCVYLTDLGLAVRYVDRQGRHLPQKKINHPCSGTWNYVGIAALEGSAPSPRDDLQSLCYTLAGTHYGQLPWSNVEKNPEVMGLNAAEKLAAIQTELIKQKRAATAQQLFEFLPPPMHDFWNHCFTLPYGTRPDYTMLRKCIFHAAAALNMWLDFASLDWIEVENIPEEKSR